MLKLIEKNCTWFECASEELKDKKEVVMKAVEHNEWLINQASSRVQKDKIAVLAAVKSGLRVIIELHDNIVIDHIIYETACYCNNDQFRDDFLLEHNLTQLLIIKLN